MTSTCTRLTSRSVTPRVVVAGVVLALALAPSGAAYAQSEGPSTIRALIGGDGSVSSVERLTGEDSSEASADDIPLKMAISRSVDGDTTTTKYEVENTTATTKAVEYLDADGNPGSAAQDVALPLVAQLAVRLPSTRTDVEANGARITKLADGSTELVWSLVLFSPIGSPQQDVSFSAKGEGEPLARLDSMAVSPSGAPGLAATSQAANATVNGNAILSVVGNGANDGLLKLSDGVGKLLDGLNKLEDGANKLNAGLADKAAPGAQKLADGGNKLRDGLKTASDGSKQLSDGLGSASAGGGKLSDGLSQLDAGGAKLSAGLSELNSKAAALGPGSAQLAAGSAKLSAGLGDLQAGVNALPDTLKANPGYKQLKAALDGVQTGIGTPTTAPLDSNEDGIFDETLLNGVAQLKLGLSNPAWDTNGNGKVDVFAAPGQPGSEKNERPGIKEAANLVSGGLSRGDAPAQTLTLAQVTALKASLAGVGAKQNVAFLKTMMGCDSASPLRAFGPSFAGQEACSKVTRQTEIAGGVNVLDRSVTMEPELLDGVLDGLLDGVGNASTPNTALFGLAGIAGGAGDFVPHTSAPTNAATLINGLQKIQFGLSNAGWDLNKNNAVDAGERPGVKEVQALVSGGIDQLIAGISAALSPGVTQLSDGSKTLAAGQKSVADSAGPLLAGISQLNDGGKQLSAGLGTASKGSGDLSAGLKLLAAGGKKLSDGLPAAVDGAGQIGAGAGELAKGLNDAADGSGKIADGLGTVVEGQTKVDGGLKDVREKAIEVLRSQFAQGTTLARQQLAGLDASNDLISETPGAANTTWVLTQSTGDIGFQNVSNESGMSDLGRNAALAAGGALLLMAGVAGGFLSGRRNAVAAAHAAAPTE